MKMKAVCPNCNGSGWVHDYGAFGEDDIHECYTCQGKGFIYVDVIMYEDDDEDN